MKPLCIYHGNCADGFGAAWAIWNIFGNQFDYHAGKYGDQPPDVTGRKVLIVDFSYKRPILEQMGQVADGIVILDHHNTAQQDLQGFPAPPEFSLSSTWFTDPKQEPIYALFDMNRSGAGITWDYITNGMKRPPLLDHIEDRDLWRFKLLKTREINAAVFSYPYDFKVWGNLMCGVITLDDLTREGEALERKHFKDINELLKVTQRRMLIGGLDMPVANLPYTFSSDAGNVMAKADACKAAACYWDVPDGRMFSLRSTDDGPDVSQIAKSYGGGGHIHASGFKVARGWEGDQL